jgi:hypothetical protein
MTHKLTKCLTAGVLAVTLAIPPPALAFRGGGGGFGGGMHGGFGGGMHAMGGGMHAWGGGMHIGGMGGGPRFSGARFVGAPFTAQAAFTPRFSHAAFQPGFRPGFVHRGSFHRPFFFHRRFHRFAFFGAPFFWAGYGGYYDDCWRRVWTGYGVQWVNVCYDYGY